MRTLWNGLLVLLLCAHAASAAAQARGRSRDSLGVEGGFESTFITRAMYARRIELGPLRDAGFFARFTLPIVRPDLSDWAIEGGLRGVVLSSHALRLELVLGPVLRNTANDLYAATGLGIGATARFGYEAVHWGISGELSHEQLLTTHVSHSDLYRAKAYANAKEGWYGITGSTTRAGVRAAVRFGAFEVFTRLGVAATGYLQPALLPFYLTLGGSRSF